MSKKRMPFRGRQVHDFNTDGTPGPTKMCPDGRHAFGLNGTIFLGPAPSTRAKGRKYRSAAVCARCGAVERQTWSKKK